MNHTMSNQEINRNDLESRTIDINNEFDQVYESSRIRRELIKQDYYASSKRVSTYMKFLGLRSIVTKKYKPGKTEKIPEDKENLMEQDFSADYPNQK